MPPDVHLRPFTERDTDMLINLSTDPYLPLIGSLPADTDHAGALGFVERQHARGSSFCVADRVTGLALGTAGLNTANIAAGRASAGYAVAPRSRGRGVAAAALRELTRFAWSIGSLHRIELYIEPWNTASIRTAERAGYEREGLLRSHQEIGGRRVDMLLYAIIR